MIRSFALIVACAATSVGLARAQTYDPIETRQAGQDLLSGTFAGIRAVVASKGDVKKLEDPANAMARWIRQFPTQFPPGSDKGHNTKALPAIWSDPAGFRKKADNFVAAAEQLAALAKAGDTDGVAAQVKTVGDACLACHHDFRAR